MLIENYNGFLKFCLKRLETIIAIIIKIIYSFYTIYYLFILLSIYFNFDISKLFYFFLFYFFSLILRKILFA